jgi:hypothetical protein
LKTVPRNCATSDNPNEPAFVAAHPPSSCGIVELRYTIFSVQSLGRGARIAKPIKIQRKKICELLINLAARGAIVTGMQLCKS